MLVLSVALEWALLAAQMYRSPPVHQITSLQGSISKCCVCWVSSVMVTTASAFAIAVSASPSTVEYVGATPPGRLPFGCTSTAPDCMASSGSSTYGSGSRTTFTKSSASSTSLGDGAPTAAMICPEYLVSSLGNGVTGIEPPVIKAPSGRSS